MTRTLIPANVHRPPKNPRTTSEAIRTMQKVSDASRDVPVTLAKAPWEKEESDD
jgi:hypothetical protein